MSKVKIEGVDSLFEKLDKLENINLEQALNKACIIVENKAREKCPVDTGELRRSITHQVEDNVGIVGTNLSYAPYVEFGTGLFASEGNGRQDRWSYQDTEGVWHSTIGQKPQPYLMPAFQESKDKIEKIFIQTIKESIQ